MSTGDPPLWPSGCAGVEGGSYHHHSYCRGEERRGAGGTGVISSPKASPGEGRKAGVQPIAVQQLPCTPPPSKCLQLLGQPGGHPTDPTPGLPPGHLPGRSKRQRSAAVRGQGRGQPKPRARKDPGMPSPPGEKDQHSHRDKSHANKAGVRIREGGGVNPTRPHPTPRH